ncbi:MAG: 1-acyl-sn-glycerol-3-phosphate acyltransferase [Acidimicrobiia bacterium]|nr:1-acyl-sn-glycerol-3-phosphate acyltransferase [Acidimicrobiia bacterium]
MTLIRRLRRFVDTVATPPSRLLSRAYFDLSVEGAQHVPPTGKVVLASNHFSHLDPPLLGVHTDRPVRFLAVDELFGKSRVLDGALRFWDAIPLDRDGYPVAAMRQAIRHLEDDGVLALFPEGRRVERWGVNDPKRGAAWLAWITGAPLIPVAIHGTQHAMTPLDSTFRRTSVRIWYEEPLWWHEYADRVDPLGSMTADWFDAVDRRLSDWMET